MGEAAYPPPGRHYSGQGLYSIHARDVSMPIHDSGYFNVSVSKLYFQARIRTYQRRQYYQEAILYIDLGTDMTIGISIELTSTYDQIEREMLISLAQQIDAIIASSIPRVKAEIAQLIGIGIRSTPEYDSLINGLLRGDLGLEYPQDDMEDIISILRDNIVVEYDPIKIVGRHFDGGIVIRFIQRDHADILEIPAASYISNEHDIDWLEWLLLRGDSVIISEYMVARGNFARSSSRTKMALMWKKSGGTFKIPPQFSGTVGSNFITRAFAGIDDILENTLRSIF